MDLRARDDEDEVHGFINPFVELNVGLWMLFAGATLFLGLRIWIKTSRRNRLWYDDYILLITWAVLLANNSLIVHEFASGYVLEDSSKEWDDRMHILINISSCGTLIGQAWSKTAFGVTLLRLSTRYVKWFLWFCIITMNLFMFSKLILQWAKICGKDSYQVWYRLDFCVGWRFREDFKEAGNIYNIVMDFIFATIPWIFIRGLELRRIEKYGLAFVMSLGMIVAIVSAVRVAWKDTGNGRDAHYIWRNGMSQIWYSSEITGTIMVQCIPVLRTFVREVRTTIASRRLSDNTIDRRSSFRVSLLSRKRSSSTPSESDKGMVKAPLRTHLEEVPESPTEYDVVEKTSSWNEPDSPIKYPSYTHTWPLPQGEDETEKRKCRRYEPPASMTGVAFDFGWETPQVLSPPPRSHQSVIQTQKAQGTEKQ